MKKIAALILLSSLPSLSACGPAFQDPPPCEDDACVAFRRNAALAILSSGGLQLPNPQPYQVHIDPPISGPVYNVHIIP